MANEVRINASLQINSGNLRFQSRPTSFQGDLSNPIGPTPGAITATIAGTDVDFSELTTPGYCLIQNLDEDNFVEIGIWDGTKFYPIMEVLPGELYPLRLSRNLSEEFGTGTGTTGTAINKLRIKADTAACSVIVQAFEA